MDVDFDGLEKGNISCTSDSCASSHCLRRSTWALSSSSSVIGRWKADRHDTWTNLLAGMWRQLGEIELTPCGRVQQSAKVRELLGAVFRGASTMRSARTVPASAEIPSTDRCRMFIRHEKALSRSPASFSNNGWSCRRSTRRIPSNASAFAFKPLQSFLASFSVRLACAICQVTSQAAWRYRLAFRSSLASSTHVCRELIKGKDCL